MYMMNAKFNMQMKQKSTYQLGIRYLGMRGTVQYEREMGGWVGWTAVVVEAEGMVVVGAPSPSLQTN